MMFIDKHITCKRIDQLRYDFHQYDLKFLKGLCLLYSITKGGLTGGY